LRSPRGGVKWVGVCCAAKAPIFRGKKPLDQFPVVAKDFDMTNELEPILAAITSLGTQVSEGFSRLDARIAGLDARIAGLEAKVAGLDGRVAGLEAGLTHVREELAELRERFDKQPDLRLLGVQMQALIERVGKLEEKNIRALAAVNDFARENVTPGEVEALHDALREIREIDFGLDVRLRKVEQELHPTP
jgi:uncharacterized coiled-coil protein SlyX